MNTKTEFICAANWKMNQDVESTRSFLKDFFKKTAKTDLKHFMFFPPALLVSEFAQYDEDNFSWGAQNFYPESQGAFTGENSPGLYKSLGAQTMLIGHSERRSLFAEAPDLIHKKLKVCTSLGLTPVLCVGEKLEERKAGQAEVIIADQLDQALGGTEKPTSLVIAYEPVWAIGTGEVAQAQDVQKMHDFIKEKMGPETRVLYGGSVKPNNAADLFALDSVDGFLIGGASLKVDSFLDIFNAMKSHSPKGKKG